LKVKVCFAAGREVVFEIILGNYLESFIGELEEEARLAHTGIPNDDVPTGKGRSCVQFTKL
jgi:hypothetical protein